MCPSGFVLELLIDSDNSFKVAVEPNVKGIQPGDLVAGSGSSATITGQDNIVITANEFVGPFIVLDLTFQVKGNGTVTISFLRQGMVLESQEVGTA